MVKLKRKLVTLYGRVQAMLKKAEFTWTLSHATWSYNSLHETKLDNLLIRPGTHLIPNDMYHGEQSEWSSNLLSFGLMTVVKYNAKMWTKSIE
jgi:hypothetical protein